MAVIGSSGRRLRSMVLETNAKVLVESVRSLGGICRLCMEEGLHCEWLYEVLEPHVEELVVIQPQPRQGTKNDAIDAWHLAEQLRTRSWTRRVIKSPSRFSILREAVRAYDVATRETTRAKNRLRALLRSRGIDVDESNYDPKARQSSLKQLKRPQLLRAECLAAQMDALVPAKELPVCRLMPPLFGDFCRVMPPPDLQGHAATSERDVTSRLRFLQGHAADGEQVFAGRCRQAGWATGEVRGFPSDGRRWSPSGGNHDLPVSYP